MIESKNDANRNLEKALQALEQAKQRVANEKKRKAEVTYSPRLRGAHISPEVACALSEGQVSLAMDNTSKLVYAEGIVCLAAAKRGNDNSPSQAALATL